jgi:hypothetical protein
MAAAQQVSVEEEQLLAEHLRSCVLCQEATQQYRQIVMQTFEEGKAYQSVETSRESETVDPLEHRKAKERLLHVTPKIIRLPLTDAPSVAHITEPEIKTPGFSSLGQPSWVTWAVAACLILAVSAALIRYRISLSHGPTTARSAIGIGTDTSKLQSQIEELKQQLANVQVERERAVAAARSTAAEQVRDLQAGKEQLGQAVSRSEEIHKQDTAQSAAVEEQVRLLQSSVDVLQASNTRLDADNKGLLQQVSSLSAGLRESQDEIKSAKNRNEELTQASLSQVHSVERQQKLLATDHDLRDILGARSLRIIDVYDVGSGGEFERPFGRIFYTEGKSLIFYAFDLDKQKGLKSGATFQAWGAKEEGNDTPHSLGAFYMDEPSQNRWILKVDDSKLLSRIDYVFVTDSSHKEGVKPRGRPLLSASLNGSANHQ